MQTFAPALLAAGSLRHSLTFYRRR